jgi:hypothetical protein
VTDRIVEAGAHWGDRTRSLGVQGSNDAQPDKLHVPEAPRLHRMGPFVASEPKCLRKQVALGAGLACRGWSKSAVCSKNARSTGAIPGMLSWEILTNNTDASAKLILT